jgi:hypothetical protein
MTRGDHILVDENFNIRAIIDWELASTEIKEIAFSSLCMMWPAADFYNRKNNLSSGEVEFADIFEKRGRSDMAELLLKGRKWQRFLVSLSEKMPSDLEELQAMFQGLRAAFLHENEAHGLEPHNEWRAQAIARYAKNDAQLQKLLRENCVSTFREH